MRTITHGDIVAAARAVRALPPHAQIAAVRSLLTRAHAADLYRKRLGRSHPFWGNGSLMGVALGSGRSEAEPFLSDTSYLQTLLLVIETVIDWRRRAG